MSELAVALGAAQSTAAMGAALAEFASREIGLSAFSFLRQGGSVLTPEDLFVLNSRESGRVARERVLEILPAVDRELEPFAHFFASKERSFDVKERWPRDVVLRSSVYNELWRRIGVEQQLVGPLGDPDLPIGFCCVARSARERPFDEDDLARFEQLRLTAERSLVSAARLGTGRLEETLAVLAKAEQRAWFLFDQAGELHWLTEEAAARLARDAARVGGAYAIRNGAALGALRAWVRANARRHADGLSCRAAPTELAARGEVVTVRRFELRPGRSHFLIGFAPAPAPAIPADAEARAVSQAERAGEARHLTPRQVEVLSLVATGSSNRAIAEQLGCEEGTVEFHVTRILAAFGCESRAQLIARLWMAS
ncbi:MAG: helix-turn-helix transcriptional regulator [Anaeromyxobacter sp.]